MVKVLTEVRSTHTRLTPDNVGLEFRKFTSLRGIVNTAKRKPKHRFQNLYHLINPNLLYQAWRKLNKRAAIADDDLTIAEYEENLLPNLLNLNERLKGKRYKTKLVKRVYILKENGKKRPLGIPALEDKIVQRAVAMILESIYEQDFISTSYGYRPNMSSNMAASDLSFQLQYGSIGYIVEADIKGFFDNIDHEWLLEMMAHRIDDKALIQLIRQWLKAGILEPNGMINDPDTGTPQGGIVSPILANIYLHYVLDSWFAKAVKPRCAGRAFIMRYADDWVCGFQFARDAQRFYDVLPKRLERFNLEVEPSKTNLIRFSRFHPSKHRSRTFNFLGFEFYWWPDRGKTVRVMRRTSRKKLQGAIQRVKDWIKKNRHLPIKAFFSTLNRKLTGHYNYYYVNGNGVSVWSFYSIATAQAYKWLNRRSQRKSFNWFKFKCAMEYYGMPKPRLTEKKRVHRIELC